MYVRMDALVHAAKAQQPHLGLVVVSIAPAQDFVVIVHAARVRGGRRDHAAIRRREQRRAALDACKHGARLSLCIEHADTCHEAFDCRARLKLTESIKEEREQEPNLNHVGSTI